MGPGQKQHILIVSHTFPPAPGVGGRRWAKSAKYFSRQGHHVEVLTAKSFANTQSLWTEDVLGIPQHTFANTYPRVLDSKPQGLFEKLAYRVALFKMKRKSHGTPYDRALRDEDSYLIELNKLLSNRHFDSVVVTGAPFRLLSFTAKIISNYPKTIFVADLRDPWTWGETYGYKFLPSGKLQYEKQEEKKVVESFDLITSPWQEIIEHLREVYPEKSDRIELLPHGFDPDDLPKETNVENSESEKIHLVYGGTLYPDTSSELKMLISFVGQNPERFQLDIYSNDRIESGIEVRGVTFHQPVQAKLFFQILKKSDRLILLIPEVLKNGVPTKLYELAALRVPMIAMGRPGKLSDFITQKKLGNYRYEDETMNDFLNRSIEIDTERTWLEEFALDAICVRLMDRIILLQE